MRLIDADKLNALIGDERATLHNEQRTFKAMSEIEFNTRDYMLLHLQYIIDNAPTVDFTFEETFQKTICENRLYCPARPTGKWKLDDTEQFCYCSNCEDTYYPRPLDPSWNYCPHCGSRMED